jgi:hypothetical protein
MGRLNFNLVCGIAIGTILSACSSLGFNYRHYVLNLEENLLQGPKPSDDLPISVCSRSSEGYSCVTLKLDEFYRLKADFLKQQKRIDELERECLK